LWTGIIADYSFSVNTEAKELSIVLF
jgi:hypothetical protein